MMLSRTPRYGVWQSPSTSFVETWKFTFTFRYRSVKRRRSLLLFVHRDDINRAAYPWVKTGCGNFLWENTLIIEPLNAEGEPRVVIQARGEILDPALFIPHGDLRNTAPVVAFF